MDETINTAAVAGSRNMRESRLNILYTPEDIAQSCHECRYAGAAAVPPFSKAMDNRKSLLLGEAQPTGAGALTAAPICAANLDPRPWRQADEKEGAIPLEVHWSVFASGSIPRRTTA